MSYIRTLSNPEGLYIFGGRDGVEIYVSWKGQPETNGFIGTVPQETWDALCRAYTSWDYDENESLNIDHLWLTWDWVEDEDGRNYKAMLGYKSDWILTMWEVTWEYIISRYRRERDAE